MTVVEGISENQERALVFKLGDEVVSNACRIIVKTGFEFAIRQPLNSPSGEILFEAHLLDAQLPPKNFFQRTERILLKKAGYLPKAN